MGIFMRNTVSFWVSNVTFPLLFLSTLTHCPVLIKPGVIAAIGT